MIVVIASLFPAKLHASDLWLDANYAKPLRWNVGAFLFFDQDDVQNRNGGRRIIVGEMLVRTGRRHGEVSHWTCPAVGAMGLWIFEL